MSKIENPVVARAFDRYPEPRRRKMMRLRQLVLDAASETPDHTGTLFRISEYHERSSYPASAMKTSPTPLKKYALNMFFC